MFIFHGDQIRRLKELATTNAPFCSITVYGDEGLGKSQVIDTVLETLKIKRIIISFNENDVSPLHAFVTGLQIKMNNPKENILMTASLKLQQGYCLIFENMEHCTEDVHKIINQLVDYHKSNKCTAFFIFEFNGLSCDIPKAYLDNCVEFKPIANDIIQNYLNDLIDDTKHKQALCSKLISITSGNLMSLKLALNILKQRGIIEERGSLLVYSNSDKPLDNSLVSLYTSLFSELKEHIQEKLQIIAPLGKTIHTGIIKEVFENCKKIDNSLEDLSKHRSFIQTDKLTFQKNLFDSKYEFISNMAIDAVLQETPNEKIERIISRLYDYLDTILNNTAKYQELSREDQVLLLLNLSKIRKDRLNINQIPYIIKVMEYYYDQMLYFSVIEYGEVIIDANILNIEQMNLRNPNFFNIYFKSLLNVGNYVAIINYSHDLFNEEIQYLISLAYYNLGKPYVSLEILDKLPNKTCQCYSLKASIFDWLGNNKKSEYYFKKSLNKLNSNEDLKYHLYKKYSMYIDFDLPECRNKMKEAVEYYSTNNTKQYAECLHNLGTQYVMSFEYDTARKYLKTSLTKLSDLCETEVYYSKNSLAILHCFQNDIESAIEIWEDINLDIITVDFCKLAIQNNLLNAYIQINSEKAEKLQKDLKQTIEMMLPRGGIESAKKQRPDIQHQIRQYYFNCAYLSEKKQQNDEALVYYEKSLECSSYDSVLVYTIKKSIAEFKRNSSSIKKLFSINKIPSPSKLEEFIYRKKMYLCEVMFWG